MDVDRDARLVDTERQTNIAMDIIEAKIATVGVRDDLSLLADKLATENAELRSHTVELLQLAMQLNSPINRVAEQLSNLTDHLANDKGKRLTILEWLSTVPYEQHHQNICKDRLQMSGRWLLEKPEFASWRSSSVSSILWLHGIPGSGKTKLV